jgi:hypothetical protein
MNLKVGDRVELSTIGKSRFHDLCNGTVTDICHENNKYDCIVQFNTCGHVIMFSDELEKVDTLKPRHKLIRHEFKSR